MRFVENPNLPKKASGVIISPSAPDFVIHALEDLKIQIFLGCELSQPVAAVSAHPDTQIVHLGKNLLIASLASHAHYTDTLKIDKIRILQGSTSGMGNYPSDIAYNIAWVGDHIFHNFKYTDETLLPLLSGKKINVKQGYCKCSICPIGKNTIITDDDGIAKAAIANNIDVLKISKGSIALPQLSYGLIGGASCMLSQNVLAFAGDITQHSDYKQIAAFCKQKEIEILPLGSGRLTDIGSILPIIEEE